MFWRKLKLDWSYAVGELLIVVFGVLIALGINQWNNERLEAAEEVEAVTRLLADIQSDLQNFESRLDAVDAKEAGLYRVKAIFAAGEAADPKTFLRDIIVGADFGWNQGLASRSTYDDLLGSGKLGIITDARIRFQIADYYRSYADSHNRIDERETDYPKYSYQLAPRGISAGEREGWVWERELESGLTDKQLNEIVAQVQDSPIEGHVTAEINLARFIRGITLDLQNQAESLASLLEEYQADIQ